MCQVLCLTLGYVKGVEEMGTLIGEVEDKS